MCGITGFFYCGKEQHNIPRATLERMVSMLYHRGPDEAGLYIDDRVGLGHARLSIIDLSSGSQPMHNEDKTKWIVFNGEIYNYIELRAGLLEKGHRFTTNSDTEVIVHAYEQWGPRCVEMFNGQWAFALWDRVKRELFLSRDRLGVRPLHYMRFGDFFLFASEIKSIVTFPGVPREIDPLALDQVFTIWTTLPGRTMFKNINELRPGCRTLVTPDGFSEEHYWNLPFYPPDSYSSKSPDDMVADISELLLDSIRLRLRADVPVGAYLSGGLDSSGVTALVARNFNANVKTFGIRFEEDAFDEGNYQAMMVARLNTDHAEVTADNRIIRESFAKVIRHVEKPLLRTGPVPLYLLSRLVYDSGIKVVLTGEGADEFFGGYDIFREALVRKFCFRRPESAMRQALFTRLHPDIFRTTLAKQAIKTFLSSQRVDDNDPLYSHLVRWRTTARIREFFSVDFRRSIDGYDALEDLRKLLPPQFSAFDTLTRAQYLETMIFLSNYLLSSQGDRVAMGNSIEIRFPYLDHRLVEYMGRVPPTWKILGLREKHLLKKLYAPLLPDEIVNRAKQPYRAPIQKSLFDPADSGNVDSLLDPSALARDGIFDGNRVAMLLSKIRAGRTSSETDGMAFAGILSTQIFLEQFLHSSLEPIKTHWFTVVEDYRTGEKG
ncbi:MAG: asparagine synthase (glutamine-hydrolyzing) [Chitinispirillaceae bacterium]|nr:asparagine synthase (glutamine-hydrolyzing) [Chitinispirillaceae bacterium]